MKDKLWFYAGFDVARTRYNFRRTLNRTVVDGAGMPILVGADGFTQTEMLPREPSKTTLPMRTNLQMIGKIDYLVDG